MLLSTPQTTGQDAPHLDPLRLAEHVRHCPLLAHARVCPPVERVPQHRHSHGGVPDHLSILLITDGTIQQLARQLVLQYSFGVHVYRNVCPHTRMRTGGQEEWRSGETEPSVVCALWEERIPHATAVFA